MTKMEWVNLAGLIIGAAAGVGYIAHLTGRLDTLDIDARGNIAAIREATETAKAAALQEIKETADGFLESSGESSAVIEEASEASPQTHKHVGLAVSD